MGLPKGAPSKVNCIVPVGTGEPGVTDEVKVTVVPTATVVAESISVVVVDCGGAAVTVTLAVPEAML